MASSGHESNSSDGEDFNAVRVNEGNHCGFLEWKDKEWPASMKKALIAIWNLYEKEKIVRSADKLQNAREYVKLVGRKRKLQASMQEAEKGSEKLKEEKNDLEHKVAHLVTQESITRGKVLKITEICSVE